MPTDASQVVGAWITSKNIKCPPAVAPNSIPSLRSRSACQWSVSARYSTGHRRLGFGGLPGMPVVAATCDDCGYVCSSPRSRLARCRRPTSDASRTIGQDRDRRATHQQTARLVEHVWASAADVTARVLGTVAGFNEGEVLMRLSRTVLVLVLAAAGCGDNHDPPSAAGNTSGGFSSVGGSQVSTADHSCSSRTCRT